MAWDLTAWILESCVQIPLIAWLFVVIFLRWTVPYGYRSCDGLPLVQVALPTVEKPSQTSPTWDDLGSPRTHKLHKRNVNDMFLARYVSNPSVSPWFHRNIFKQYILCNSWLWNVSTLPRYPFYIKIFSKATWFQTRSNHVCSRF